MPLLNTADAVYVGDTPADAVYAGSVQVWPTEPPPPAPTWQVVDSAGSGYRYLPDGDASWVTGGTFRGLWFGQKDLAGYDATQWPPSVSGTFTLTESGITFVGTWDVIISYSSVWVKLATDLNSNPLDGVPYTGTIEYTL